MHHRWLLLALAVVTLGACNGAKKQRNKECADFSEWSNNLGRPIHDAVSESEKQAATTYEQQASICRRLAEGARKAAATPIPFTDPYVKQLAARLLKTYEGTAVGLDHQAEAWAKGDKEALGKAQLEEVGPSGSGAATEIMQEWTFHCRVN